jgi:hypothetical protein
MLLLPSVLPVAADMLSLLLLLLPLPLGFSLLLRPSQRRWGSITGSMISGRVAFSMNSGWKRGGSTRGYTCNIGEVQHLGLL